MLLLLDCGDWPLVQYLRTRGEMPVLDALIARGYSAVLDSDPPLTAAALDALVHPSGRGALSFTGLVHQLGVELAGLSSIGENPFGALAWFLPETDDLFGAIGAGNLRAANMLFAHGGIRAGRHSEITGPAGATERISVARGARDLTAGERALWPTLVDGIAERDSIHVRTIAAELDAAEDIVRAGDVDFLALRIEPLDILTHAHFAETSRDGQDDGRGILFSLYRYLDARIGGVHDLLDGDDLLIVMSDHGIVTAMEHSRDAFFVIDGVGVPPGRAPGRPSIRGVPNVVANLMGLLTSWPDAGIAPWSAGPHVAATRGTHDASERRPTP